MSLLNEDVKFNVALAGLADGQAASTLTNIDMAGWDGCLFLVMLGTITGSGTATLAIGQAATDTTVDALTGASAVATGSADSDLFLIVDIYQPTDRYLGGTLTTATANSVIGGVVAIQYRGRSKPVTQAAAAMAADAVSLVSPAEA